MRRYFILVGILISATGHTSERMLQKLQPIDFMSVVCGCTFNESIPGAHEGSYGSGPELLLLDPNGNPPHALVNLGHGNMKLLPGEPIVFPLYECKAGETFETVWCDGDAEHQSVVRASGVSVHQENPAVGGIHRDAVPELDPDHGQMGLEPGSETGSDERGENARAVKSTEL